MNPNRFPHLTEAFNSIISMMLASLRVRGWRGLLDLPNIIMAAIYLRRLGREFAAIIASLASLDLGALPPVSPARPAPQAACAQPVPAASARQNPSASPRARRTRQAASARPGAVAPRSTARRPPQPQFHRPFAQPRRTRALVALPGTARSS